MLTIILKILSILGIILLILLGVALFFLLLVLFFPVTYKAYVQRDVFSEQKDMADSVAEEIRAWVKAKWLFGLLRVSFVHPEPGELVMKVLWFKVNTKSGAEKENDADKEKNSGDAEMPATGTDAVTDTKTETLDVGANTTNANTTNANTTDANAKADDMGSTAQDENASQENTTDSQTLKQQILAKCEKIKYTFQNIYDKIKHIWENISYYKTLLEDEDTKLLFLHARSRVWKILKTIRPRKIKADILFGTGSPDTTGYLYGVYGMISPKLGKQVIVVPDFSQAVLRGEVSLAGHITMFQVLRHAVILLLDKRLRLFLDRLKAGRNKDGR